MLLVGQAVLLLAHAAYLPFAVPTMLEHPDSRFRVSDVTREFMSAWLWFGAVLIGGMYLTAAIMTLTAAWKMGKRSKWGWQLTIAAGLGGFTVACMPFGLFAVWVLSDPAVRRAMEPIPELNGSPYR